MVLNSKVWIYFLVCACLAACADPEPAARTATEATADEDPSAKPRAAQVMDIDRQMTVAKNDLADRLQVDAAEIVVVAARTVQWRSGAMGCPQPGMNYTMAIVPGVQILLMVDTLMHHYHAGIGKEPFYCPAHQAEDPANGSAGDAI